MSDEKKKRVWVLGAGFSRPLGGPLLPDVFSMRSWHKLRDCFPATFEEMQPAVAAAYAIFHYGSNFPEDYLFLQTESARTGERIFGDAEHFLVELPMMGERQFSHLRREARRTLYEVSKRAHPRLVELAALESLTQDAVVQGAKVVMACECEAFMSTVREQLEPSIPFLKWAGALSRQDTIVSFNYDRVVEELLGKRLSVAGSEQPDTTPSDAPTLCKMHGSVDWVQQGEKLVRNECLALDATGYNPMIAAPGKNKTDLTSGEGALTPVWDIARTALREASEVNIIGYGMPESDAKARQFFIDNLRQNATQRLSVRLVLGEPNFRRRRVETTLRQALSHRKHYGGMDETHRKMEEEGLRSRVRQERGKAKRGDAASTDQAELGLRNFLERTRSLSFEVPDQFGQDFLSTYEFD